MEMAHRIHDCSGRDYWCEKIRGRSMACGTATDWFYSDEANVNNKYRAASLIMELAESGTKLRFDLPPSKVTILLLCCITS